MHAVARMTRSHMRPSRNLEFTAVSTFQVKADRTGLVDRRRSRSGGRRDEQGYSFFLFPRRCIIFYFVRDP
jgi:hypothetical protein